MSYAGSNEAADTLKERKKEKIPSLFCTLVGANKYPEFLDTSEQT